VRRASETECIDEYESLPTRGDGSDGKSTRHAPPHASAKGHCGENP